MVTTERWAFLFSFPASWLSEVSETTGKVPGHTAASLCNSNTNAAQDRTHASGVTTMSAVGVFSIAWRKRNHQEETMRRAAGAGTSLRLSAIKPKPPLCNKRSTALKAFSRLWRQRIQSRRSKLTPAMAAPETSKVSPPSTNAQVSSCNVAMAKEETSTVVLPEDADPWISVIAPRGSPGSA